MPRSENSKIGAFDVLVDRDDVLRGLHADLVLDRARDARREVQLRRDGLARLADLRRVRVPAGVDDRAGRGDGVRRTRRPAPRAARSPRPCRGRGRRRRGCRRPRCSTSAPRCSPRCDHRGLRRPRRELDVDVLDRGRAAAGLLDLERVEAADDDARALVARRRDRRVAEDRALGDELAALDADGRDLHRHAGVEARGEAGADLEAEQAAAEQRVVVAVVVDHLAPSRRRPAARGPRGPRP